MKRRKEENKALCQLLDDSLLYSNIGKHINFDDTDKEYLKSIFSTQYFSKKELLLRQDTECRNIFYVESGSLRAFNLSEDGKEATIMFAVDDWWITDMYCFVNQKRALLSLEALEDSKVIVLDFDSFEMLLRRKPKFERFFRILFQNAYSREQLRALDSISLSTEERYRSFIIKYPQIVEKVTQKQIASYLGVTPEFLSSVKKK